jgi:hypothetical protein
MVHGKSELIDFLASVLPGVVESDVPCRSEAVLAVTLGAAPRWLQDLRGLGLVTPRRLGRGYVYAPGDIRRASVLVGLLRFGATLDDLAGFFAPTAERCASCSARRGDPVCGVARCCEVLLDGLRARAEAEIARLRSLDGLLQQYALDVRADLQPRRALR